MRIILSNLYLVAMSVFLLVHCILIAIYGSVLIHEHLIYIQALEIASLTAIIAFAMSNVVKIVRSR